MKKIIALLSAAIAGITAGIAIDKYIFKNKENKKGKLGKFKNYYTVLNQWLSVKQNGKNLKEYFEKKNYRIIAVYGMGEMGNHLWDELEDSGIIIKYGIDREPGNTYSEVPVYTLADELEPVDAIIVSATFAFEEIKKELQSKATCPVISLEDVISSIL